MSRYLIISAFIFILLYAIWHVSYESYSTNNDFYKYTSSRGSPTHLVCAVQRRKRILIFFGTRPETIKMAPLISLLGSKRYSNFVYKTVFTGQHPDLVEPFKKFWDIHIDVQIGGTFRAGQSLNELSSNLIRQIDLSIPMCEGDIWMVQGDTTSAFAAAVVAFHRSIPVVHIEAGLRTFNMRSPFPEEFNRRTIGSIGAIHFAPTNLSRANLIEQGVQPERIFVSGNTGIDAARLAETSILAPEKLHTRNKMIYVTMHRRENQEIMSTLYDAIGGVESCIDVDFVVPVHKNPAAERAAHFACRSYSNFHCISPLGYGESQWMLKHSICVVTDSGGLQEEATWHSKPTLILRENTERPEAVYAGLSVLATNTTYLSEMLHEMCTNESDIRKSMSRQLYPFGHGYAAEAILDTLKSHQVKQLLEVPLKMVKPIYKDLVLNNTAMIEWNTVKHSDHDKTDFQSDAHNNINTCSSEMPAGWTACSEVGNIDVVLTVYMRGVGRLLRQLEVIASQTKKPNHVWVLQGKNKDANEVANAVKQWSQDHIDVEITHIQLNYNGRYHFRFYSAYALSSAEYVSVWDDDVMPGKEWLQYNIDISKQFGDALVGGNSRYIKSLLSAEPPKINFCIQGSLFNEPTDLVGHSWTLKREFLKYYLAEAPYTYATGEDMQLSFALQKHGIISISPQHDDPSKQVRDLEPADSFASYKHGDLQVVRQLLFCQLLRDGFAPVKCENCDEVTIAKCVAYFSEKLKELPRYPYLDE